MSPVAATVATGSRSSSLVLFVVGIVLVLSLIAVAVAATPPWVVPVRVHVVAYEHRETVIPAGAVIVASIAVGFLASMLGS